MGHVQLVLSLVVELLPCELDVGIDDSCRHLGTELTVLFGLPGLHPAAKDGARDHAEKSNKSDEDGRGGARHGARLRRRAPAIGGATGLGPHAGQLPEFVLIPSASRRLMEHGMEFGGVHLRNLPRHPLAAEPLRDVEDRHRADHTPVRDATHPRQRAGSAALHHRVDRLMLPPPPIATWFAAKPSRRRLGLRRARRPTRRGALLTPSTFPAKHGQRLRRCR